jgi:hypothetical protein
VSRSLDALLASPRRRRRLAWLSAGALVAAATALGIILLPGSPKPVPEHLRPGARVDNQTEVRLTPKMRRGIDKTLVRFVRAAVTGNDPALAWALAGPGLRAGTTRRGWLQGGMPVYRFPWSGDRRELEGWKPVFTYRNRVGLDLVLGARRESKTGTMAVSVDVVRRGATWLVDYWNVTAIM